MPENASFHGQFAKVIFDNQHSYFQNGYFSKIHLSFHETHKKCFMNFSLINFLNKLLSFSFRSRVYLLKMLLQKIFHPIANQEPLTKPNPTQLKARLTSKGKGGKQVALEGLQNAFCLQSTIQRAFACSNGTFFQCFYCMVAACLSLKMVNTFYVLRYFIATIL